ncbi:SCO family protein [Pseudobdellovibrio sp. HCB154]|uniref:SCO family protein n=1 Tax=Pseudobdellovibrio sp. HCB154 TaxID=3386277 RepID=UPI0039173BE6
MKKTFLVFLLLGLNSWANSGAVLAPQGAMSTYTGKQEAANSAEVPAELKGVGIKEHLGESIDLNLQVRDESGQLRTLGSYFKSHKPVMLSPVYFNCPGLCNFHFNGVVETLQKVDWNPGDKFEVIAFSFDSKENSELALAKKANYMKMYNRAGTENGFHFLTADEVTIKKLTDALGFEFRWNAQANEWSHASAAIVITPDGKISRYLHGIAFEPKDMKLALNEASNGKIGNIIDSVVLFCFKYDEHQSKYGLQVFRVVQLAGAFMVLILALWLTPVLIRAGREKV